MSDYIIVCNRNPARLYGLSCQCYATSDC